MEEACGGMQTPRCLSSTVWPLGITTNSREARLTEQKEFGVLLLLPLLLLLASTPEHFSSVILASVVLVVNPRCNPLD